MTNERFQQVRNGGKGADFTPAFIHSGGYISNGLYTAITHPRDMQQNIFSPSIATGLQTPIHNMEGGSTARCREYIGLHRWSTAGVSGNSSGGR